MSKWCGVGLLVLFVCFPRISSRGISSGLETGLLVLMPSIFPYMVVSQVAMKTGGIHLFCRMFQKNQKLKPILELLIPSLFCGYPTGARLASNAYNKNKITKFQLYQMFGFGNIPGFGFTVSYVGGVLYQSVWLGLQIYLSFLFASLILMGISCAMIKQEETGLFSQEKERFLSFPSALVESVTESSLTMVSLICFVCFFSSLISYLQSFLQDGPLCSVLCAILEITAGLPLLSKFFPLPFVIFFTAFSGLCVIFQSIFFDKTNAVNLLYLLILRSIYGITCVLCFFGMGYLFGQF